jgi:hypothetical protein
MSIRQRKGFKAIAVFLAFAMAQIYVQISLAEPATTTLPVPLPQQFVARLTTRGNQPILVNGNSAATGASILTGATIETPADIGATIDLGALGSLDLGPNTKVELVFDDNGNVRVKLITGCAILRTKKNASGEINTEQGNAGKSDKKTGGVLNFCFPPGASGPTAGTAVDVGAGVAVGGGGPAGGEGLGKAAIIAIIAGGGAAAIVIPLALHRGGNPSGTTPGT